MSQEKREGPRRRPNVRRRQAQAPDLVDVRDRLIAEAACRGYSPDVLVGQSVEALERLIGTADAEALDQAREPEAGSSIHDPRGPIAQPAGQPCDKIARPIATALISEAARLPEALPAAEPAQVVSAPPARKVHATQLFPHLRAGRDPRTGAPIPTPKRTGGQFSVRRLVFVNQFTGETRTVWLKPSIQAEQFPIQPHERWSDPAKVPSDNFDPNLEVVFDFEQQVLDFWRSLGMRGDYDPLRRSDIPQGTFPPAEFLPHQQEAQT